MLESIYSHVIINIHVYMNVYIQCINVNNICKIHILYTYMYIYLCTTYIHMYLYTHRSVLATIQAAAESVEEMKVLKIELEKEKEKSRNLEEKLRVSELDFVKVTAQILSLKSHHSVDEDDDVTSLALSPGWCVFGWMFMGECL